MEHGIGRFSSRQVDVSARAQAAAYRRWELEVKSSQEIRQDLEDLTDRGVLEEEVGAVTCTRCNAVIAPGESFCRRCGAEPGEEDAVNEPDPDEEIWRDELAPVHGPDEEMETEIPSELGFVEKLREPLLELGWDLEEAGDAAVRLARIFEGAEAMDAESYEAVLRKEEIPENGDSVIQKLLDPDVQSRVLDIAKMQLGKTSGQTTAAKADIRIFRGDGGAWQVEAEDLLEGKVAVNPSAKEREYLEILQRRRPRLRAIGEQLLHHFRQEFFEQGIEQANKALVQRAMEQKKVARAADVPESTFSRWCNPEEGGVWVSTLHGPYRLGDFFRRTATTSRGKVSRAGIIGLVIQAKQDIGDAIPGLGDRLSQDQNKHIRKWLERHDINMAERTLRGYWRDASSVVGIAQRAELRKQGKGVDDIPAEKLREELREESELEFDDAQFNLYLQLSQFSKDQLCGRCW